MNKGDIKATIILMTYISVGIISGYYLEEHNPSKDGGGAICGFVFGMLGVWFLQTIWWLIRINIED